jgi:hypothetical protein
LCECAAHRAVPGDAAFDLSFAREAAADLDRVGWKP